MTVMENATNVKSVVYTNLGNRCPAVIQQKMRIHSMVSCGCAVVCIDGKKYEAYEVFHYNFRKDKEYDRFYSIFSFKHAGKKEFILRIVTWDRIHAAESIRTHKKADLCIESNVYYLSGDRAKKLNQQLKKISQILSNEIKFVHKDTDYLEQEVYMDLNGEVEKNFRWRTPYFEEHIQATLESFVACVTQMIDGLKQTISSVEFVFEDCLMIDELNREQTEEK